jgi:hypothetical protein
VARNPDRIGFHEPTTRSSDCGTSPNATQASPRSDHEDELAGVPLSFNEQYWLVLLRSAWGARSMIAVGPNEIDKAKRTEFRRRQAVA